MMRLLISILGIVLLQVVITTRHVRYSTSPAPPPAFATTIDTGTVILDSGELQEVVSNDDIDTSNTFVIITQTGEGTTQARFCVGVEVRPGFFRVMRGSGTQYTYSTIVRYQIVRISSGYTTRHRKFAGNGLASQNYWMALGGSFDSTKSWVTYTMRSGEGGGFYGEFTIGSGDTLFPTNTYCKMATSDDLRTDDTVFVVIHSHDSVAVTRVYNPLLMSAGTLTADITTAGSIDSAKEMLVPLYTGDVTYTANAETDTTGSWGVTFERTSTSIVKARRNIAQWVDIERLCLQSVKFLDGTQVYHTYKSVASSELVVTVTHTPVDWSRTTLTTPSQPYACGRSVDGTGGGRYPGKHYFAMRPLTSSTYEAWRRVNYNSTAANHLGTIVQWGKYQ